MIGTLNIKEQQLTKSFFTTGSGKEVILIMGSCRVAPYVNYLDLWNRTIGENRFTIHSVDPFNHHYHPTTNEMVDLKVAIKACENDERLLNMFKSVDIFLHEYYKNFGLYNIFKGDGDKNIYDFGMQPKIDVMIPSFNDIFILFNDFYALDPEFKKLADYEIQYSGRLTIETQKSIFVKAGNNLNKFYDVCLKSDLPEMLEVVETQMKTERFYWNFNHVSKYFTLAALKLMNAKFLKLDMSREYISEISKTDMFENPHTPLCEYDVEIYGFQWTEPVVNFKEYNKIGV